MKQTNKQTNMKQKQNKMIFGNKDRGGRKLNKEYIKLIQLNNRLNKYWLSTEVSNNIIKTKKVIVKVDL
jgi:hypothetical protein